MVSPEHSPIERNYRFNRACVSAAERITRGCANVPVIVNPAAGEAFGSAIISDRVPA